MHGEVQHFASAPQAVGTRKKYRDPGETEGKNLMYDKRIIRGSNYTALVPQQPDMAEVQKQREAQRRKLMRANQTKKRITTPEPVMGRKHMDIQTDSYLEELTERIVEFEAETQTDFLLDRPASPLFMPAKNGVDIQTQIEEGDLFDFDVECEPVLEVIVGKTLEQSMMEVLEEEELESLRRHQEDYQKRRNAELQEVQRMEAAEKRRSDEVERRRQQQAAQKEQDMSMMRMLSLAPWLLHTSAASRSVLWHIFWMRASLRTSPSKALTVFSFLSCLRWSPTKCSSSLGNNRPYKTSCSRRWHNVWNTMKGFWQLKEPAFRR